jgi:predicted acylesterase/phospholipase RssA
MSVTRDGIGVALAGGGPLGAIYEIGALAALHEVLDGFEANACDVYVGVSSGAFIAAGLANGLAPAAMHRMFIESEIAEDPFDPEVLVRPAFREYLSRLARVAPLIVSALHRYLEKPGTHGFVESFLRLGHALPTGVFDNTGIDELLTRLFSGPGCVNDFRLLERKLFLVATDLDSGKAVPFGSKGWDAVPISTAVRASAALPGLFPPVEIDGHWFVDGVLTRTVHASLALRAGAKLLFCVNPLVPFDADLAAHRSKHRRINLVEGGLPQVLSQTFRAIIHSRMEIGMDRYKHEFPDADVLLFEPARDDAEMFFTNVFSYADRRRLCEHAYQRTREELRLRRPALEPILARHGIGFDRAALDDPDRKLSHHQAHRRKHPLGSASVGLGHTLDRLEELLAAHYGVTGRG